MNIFALDDNPRKCAEYHVDKHVVKMILETAQLLCGVHWLTGSNAPYKLTHINHPSAIWVRKCIENYNWLCDLGLELCVEYTYRYEKTHKSEAIITWCKENKPNLFSNGIITLFAMAMPDECKIDSPILSYRHYYMTQKNSLASWKKRNKPYWFLTADDFK